MFECISAIGLSGLFADSLHARLRHSNVSQRVIALRMLLASSATMDKKVAKIAGWIFMLSFFSFQLLKQVMTGK